MENQKIVEHVVENIKKTWLRTEEAQEYLSCGWDMLKKLRDDGVVQCSKVGKLLYWNLADIDRLLKKSVVNAQLHKYYMMKKR